MALTHTFIPYGAYFCSPFCRWQGSLASQHAIELAARSTRSFLEHRRLSAEVFDRLVLGSSVPQQHAFYGAPWLAGLIGAPGITGPTLSQACATSARVLAVAATEIETDLSRCVLGVTCDRTSNGPHIYYPNPSGVGGKGTTEEWVWDNFSHDPFAGQSMVQTAENVAAEAGIGREEQDALTLLRYEQYQEGMAEQRAFQRRFMLPMEVRAAKRSLTVEEDEGVVPTTQQGLAKLKPVLEGGTVTFGSQTHPADGNAGMLLCTRERAAELSRDRSVTIQVLGFGDARVGKAMMPMAVVPAARQALQHAGVAMSAVKAVKTHNPFAVNDVYFCRQMGLAVEAVNRFGSPLIYGHPQAPTGMRAIIELIEELVLAGGGHGLFSGCAAGDTAMAVVLKVD